MDWNALSEDERLIAEEAVATYRAVKLAGRQAPHGKGLACLEEAVRRHGDELLRNTLQRVINAHDEAQKRGPAGCVVPAGAKPSSNASRPSAS